MCHQIANSSLLDAVHADIVFLQLDTTLKYHIAPYSGKLSWEKTFASWWKKDFHGQNFCGLLAGATKRPWENFRKYPQNLEIHERFPPQKFSAIW